MLIYFSRIIVKVAVVVFVNVGGVIRICRVEGQLGEEVGSAHLLLHQASCHPAPWAKNNWGRAYCAYVSKLVSKHDFFRYSGSLACSKLIIIIIHLLYVREPEYQIRTICPEGVTNCQFMTQGAGWYYIKFSL